LYAQLRRPEKYKKKRNVKFTDQIYDPVSHCGAYVLATVRMIWFQRDRYKTYKFPMNSERNNVVHFNYRMIAS
jgi:hypothetical protein